MTGTLPTNVEAASVDVIIPTHNEPASILGPTIQACLDIAYAGLKLVWVLDDSNRPEVKALAESLGCQYVGKQNNIGAKAGNINHGLAYMTGDVIAVFDADSRPVPQFLEKTLDVLFSGEKMAMVESRITYYGNDAIETFIGSHPKQGQVRVSSEALRPSRCPGSGFVMRRSVLNELGGFPTETLVEDFHLTLKLYSQGWLVGFVAGEPLCANSRPYGLEALLKQQIRLIIGHAQVLILRNSPVNSLKACHKVFFLTEILTRFLNVRYLPVLLLPALFMQVAAHASSSAVSIGQWCALLLVASFDLLLTRVEAFIDGRSFWWATLYRPLIAWPLAKAFVGFVRRPFALKFAVTRKPGSGGAGESMSRQLLLPLGGLVAFYLVALVMFGSQTVSTHTITLYGVAVLVWCLYSVAALISAIRLCLSTEGATTESPQ